MPSTLPQDRRINPSIYMTVEKWVLVITYLIVDMKPVMRLMGHNDNITKLQWNSFHRGLLASSSDDSSVCLWNVYIILTS